MTKYFLIMIKNKHVLWTPRIERDFCYFTYIRIFLNIF